MFSCSRAEISGFKQAVENLSMRRHPASTIALPCLIHSCSFANLGGLDPKQEPLNPKAYKP